MLGARNHIFTLILLVSLIGVVSTISIESVVAIQQPRLLTLNPPSSPSANSSGEYWFQVGARMPGTIDATGASVQIQVRSPQRLLDSATLAYWVGIDLPGDAFIQVGYGIATEYYPAESYPHWFWEYFLPGTANENAGPFLGQVGDEIIGPNGTWYTFALTAQGTLWTASVNGQAVGSVNMGVSYSVGNAPYAVAEVADTRGGGNVLGPVEFRNLEYRDTSNQWHAVNEAVSYCCYGAGSSTFVGPYRYGVESVQGQNNTWIAGSNLPIPIQNDGFALWPWYRVTISVKNRTILEWHVYGDTIDLTELSSTIPIPLPTETSQYLPGWILNGQFMDQNIFTVTADMNLTYAISTQYLVQVNSAMGQTTGSGWYDQGANVTIGVSPTTIKMSGILGELGLEYTMSGWSGDFNEATTTGRSVVQANSSMVINAVWKINYALSPYDTVLIIAGAIIVILAIDSFRQSRNQRRRRG